MSLKWIEGSEVREIGAIKVDGSGKENEKRQQDKEEEE